MNDLEKAEEKLKNLIEGMPNFDSKDPEVEFKIFTYIYTELAKLMKYDYEASDLIEQNLGGYARDMAETYCITPASNFESLGRGLAVCAGYAVVLKRALNEVGIEAVIIHGEKGCKHAWNQVKLNGKWHNCDLTNDSDYIEEGLCCPRFLKSDEYYEKLGYKFTEEKEHVCEESISDADQELYINEVKERVFAKEMEKELMSKEQARQTTFLYKLTEFIKRIFSQDKKSELSGGENGI